MFIYFDVRFQIRGGISNQGQTSSFEYQKKDQMTLLLCCEEFLQNINRQIYISIYPKNRKVSYETTFEKARSVPQDRSVILC